MTVQLQDVPHSGARRRVVRSIVTLLLATGILVTVQSAAFADTVINFDNLSPNTAVSNQYAAQGITFDQSPSGSAGYEPRVQETPDAHSPTNVLSIEKGGYCNSYGSIIPTELWAHLSAPRTNVSMYVGDWQTPIPGMVSESVTLVGYDMNGTPIPGAADTVNTNPNQVNKPISITDPGGRISFFQVQGPSDAWCLSVDDVAFSSPAPDTVTVTNPGTLNGWRGWPVAGLQITAASNYGYSLTYNAAGLPPGLGITPTGQIQGTPQTLGSWPVTVTATDTQGTRASTTFTYTITKLPPICKPTTCS